MPTQVTSVETVESNPPYLFTVENQRGEQEEVILVPCDDGVEAWINRCTHEAQQIGRAHV